TPNISRAVTDELVERLARWKEPFIPNTTWDHGVPTRWLAELVRDWQDCDFGDLENRLRGHDHMTARIDQHEVHLVHARGVGPKPFPLVLTHGWPGSFCEYLEL